MGVCKLTAKIRKDLFLDGSFEIFFASDVCAALIPLLSVTSNAFRVHKGDPHFITSKLHGSSTNMIINGLRFAQVEFANTTEDGTIDPNEITNLIRPNTFMVSVPYTNIDVGSVLDIEGIGKHCHSNNVPLHVDIGSAIGIIKIDLVRCNIDIATFRLFDVHVVIINKDVIRGYKVHVPLYGFCKTTYGKAAIQSSYDKYSEFTRGRVAKNSKLYTLRQSILRNLSKYLPVTSCVNPNTIPPIVMCVLGPDASENHAFIPNSLAISIIKTKGSALSLDRMCTKCDWYSIDVGQGGYNKYTQSSRLVATMPIHDTVKKNAIVIRLCDGACPKRTPDACCKYIIKYINDQLGDIMYKIKK